MAYTSMQVFIKTCTIQPKMRDLNHVVVSEKPLSCSLSYWAMWASNKGINHSSYSWSHRLLCGFTQVVVHFCGQGIFQG